MSTTKDLFHLIQGMSKAEKRYFKIQASNQSKNQNQDYLILYEQIRNLTKPSHEELEKRLANRSNLLKKLPVVKNYLYQTLLDTLRNFNQDKTIDQELNRILETIPILFEKDLNDQIFKLIKKARQLAEQYEKYEQLLAINNWELVIQFRKRNAEGLSNFLEDQYNSQKRALEKLDDQFELQSSLAEVFCLKEKINYVRTEEEEVRFQAIMQKPLLQEEPCEQSFEAINSFYTTHGLYQRVKGNVNISYHYSSKLLTLFDHHPDQKTTRPYKYLVAITNHLGILLDKEHYKEALNELQRLSDKKGKSQLMDKEIFMLENRVKPVIYAEYGDYDKGLALEKDISKGLTYHNGSIPLEWILDFYHEQALFNLMGNKPEKALGWVNTMLNTLPKDSLIQRHTNARILELMIRYDMEDTLYLEYAIRSTYRFLIKRERLYQFEKLAIKFLKKTIVDNEANHILADFQWLDHALDQLKQYPNDCFAMNTIKFQYWVKSKAQKISFVDAIRQYGILGAHQMAVNKIA